MQRCWQYGFTLVELMVVIGILGMLSTFIFGSYMVSQSNAKRAKAQADLKQIQIAVEQLENDTGKWPGGCPAYARSWSFLYLNIQQAGLVGPRPTAGGFGCTWLAAEVSKWNGPYSQARQLVDPWGNSYYYVGVYDCGQPLTGPRAIGCEGFTPGLGQIVQAISSGGPNKSLPWVYDADNIVLILSR